MSNIAIVIDSTTVLPKEVMAKYKVPSAPAVIIWEGEELRDAIDIQPEEFYTRLASSPEHPTTSQATPVMFKEIYEPLLAEGKDILTITITSKLSGMYNSAIQAKEMFPGANIEVLDSRYGAIALVWPLIKVLEAAEAGATLAECKELVENAFNNIGLLITPEDLKYLHRGGRIGSSSRFIGTALNFKPIIELTGGVLEGLERVRTRKKALNRLVELVIERINGRTPVYLGVAHANALDVASKVLEMAGEQIDHKASYITSVSPAIGVHLGPGTIGLGFMAGIE